MLPCTECIQKKPNTFSVLNTFVFRPHATSDVTLKVTEFVASRLCYKNCMIILTKNVFHLK